VLSTVGSNLTLKAKQLSIDVQKPFQILHKNFAISTSQTIVNDVRTFFTTEPDWVIPLLPDPAMAEATESQR
jgi:hypothetical protein